MNLKGAWTTKHTSNAVSLTLESAEVIPEQQRVMIQQNLFPDRRQINKQRHMVVVGLLDADDLRMIMDVCEEGIRELGGR